MALIQTDGMAKAPLPEQGEIELLLLVTSQIIVGRVTKLGTDGDTIVIDAPMELTMRGDPRPGVSMTPFGSFGIFPDLVDPAATKEVFISERHVVWHIKAGSSVADQWIRATTGIAVASRMPPGFAKQ